MCESLEDLFCIVTQQIKSNNNLENSQKTISEYCGNDWKKYVTNQNTGYIKKLVIRNDIAELYVITWSPNSESQIHDHPDIGCVVKVVKGKLQEDIYLKNGQSTATFSGTNHLILNSLGFRSGNNILHKIINTNSDGDMYSVSIHIYSEPRYIQNKYNSS